MYKLQFIGEKCSDVPMYLVPTELTENTEAYGLVFFESTERIDAARHTTDDTEMIAWVASPKVANYTIISVNSCLAKRRQFCGFQKLKARRLLCFL